MSQESLADHRDRDKLVWILGRLNIPLVFYGKRGIYLQDVNKVLDFAYDGTVKRVFEPVD